MIPFCVDQGVGLIPWSPLARGFLAGNRTRDKSGDTTRSQSDEFAHGMYYADSDFDIVDRVVAMAQAKNVAPVQIALAWILHKPGVSAPIIGATKLHHLEQAAGAVDIDLTDEEIAHLEELYQPHVILGHG